MTEQAKKNESAIFFGPEIQRYIIGEEDKPITMQAGGINFIYDLILSLTEPKGSKVSRKSKVTEFTNESWYKSNRIPQFPEPIKQKNNKNSKGNIGNPQIFLLCKESAIPQNETEKERLVILHDADLKQYDAVFDPHTTLVTDAQTLACLGLQIPPVPYDYERQVGACIKGLYDLDPQSPLLKLRAIVILLSTASALILDKTVGNDAESAEWNGVFVYLPNLYDTAQPPLKFLHESPRVYEAFLALLAAKWLKGDTDDIFNLRSIARYRLSLAIHDALLLNSALIHPNGAGEKAVPALLKMYDLDLGKINAISEVDLKRILLKIRNAKKDWHHPIHVPIENLQQFAGKPWSLLGSLQLDGYTIARHIWDKKVYKIKGIPMMKMGKLRTFDAAEVSGALRMEQLMRAYLDGKETKTLNLAVFGPPGAGKSFFVNQIVQGINDKRKEKEKTIELQPFNLSQVPVSQASSVMVNVFHIIRDISLKGKMPLLFVDEFDTENFQWIKLFLAPMQDSQFIEGTETHQLPPCIFVFAGGVTSSLDELLRTPGGKEKKIPDFASRLDAALTVKGLNPDIQNDPNCMYIARRALLIKAEMEKRFSGYKIEEGLLYALLHVSQYKGGARTISKLIAAINDPGNKYVHRLCLPADTELTQYLDVCSFQKQYEIGQVLYAEADRIACLVNTEYYRLQKEHHDKVCNTYLTQVEELGEPEKDGNKIRQGNRDGTLHLPSFLYQAGYEIALEASLTNMWDQAGKALESDLACMEHMRWMAIRMLNGAWFGTKKIEDKEISTNPYFVDCATLRKMSVCKKEGDNHTAYELDQKIANLHLKEFQRRFFVIPIQNGHASLLAQSPHTQTYTIHAEVTETSAT